MPFQKLASFAVSWDPSFLLTDDVRLKCFFSVLADVVGGFRKKKRRNKSKEKKKL